MPLTLIRLTRGEDLVEGIEAAAQAQNITQAIIRCGPGSLDSGCVQTNGPPIEIPGPGAEILTLIGEMTPDGASLYGTVGDPEGRIYAGRFVRGRNPVCITVELALETDGG